MSRRVPRAVYILAAAAGLGTLVYVGIFWKDLGRRYRLRQLRVDPDRLLVFLEEPEGTLTRAAVREYLEGTEGKVRLIRFILESYPAALESTANPGVLRILLNVYPESFTYQGRETGGKLAHVGGASSPVRASLTLAIGEVLPAPETNGPGIGTALPGLPGVRFRLVRGSGETGLEAPVYQCIVERDRPSVP